MSLRSCVERLERSQRGRGPLRIHVVYPEDPEPPEDLPEGTTMIRVMYDDPETGRDGQRHPLAGPALAG
jgi:hypothetical protein